MMSWSSLPVEMRSLVLNKVGEGKEVQGFMEDESRLDSARLSTSSPVCSSSVRGGGYVEVSSLTAVGALKALRD